ncbi:MAG: hypothetical protein JNL94_01805 [Planctomycetes bacterium]|nr:hypothetical protein [Planctomycetota bacterium]
MFDRFTDRARKVMNLAKQEAQRLKHEYIGTEHILLGLIQEGSGVAASVPKDVGIDSKRSPRTTGVHKVEVGSRQRPPGRQQYDELGESDRSVWKRGVEPYDRNRPR